VRVDGLFRSIAHRTFDIAHGRHLGLGETHQRTHVAEAHGAHADRSHDNALAWRDSAGTAQRRRWDYQRDGGECFEGALQEFAPLYLVGHGIGSGGD